MGQSAAHSFASIAFVGEAMVEHNAYQMTTENRFAGDALNAAVYFRRATQGALDVQFVSRVGSSQVSKGLVEFIRANGIGTDFISEHASRDIGSYHIYRTKTGDRGLTYDRNKSAARTLFSTDDRLTLSDLSVFDAIYLTAITLAILPPTIRDNLFQWLSVFKRNSGVVIFDSNYRPHLWESVDAARANVERYSRLSDIVLPSFEDEAVLFGDQSVSATVNRLMSYGLTKGVVRAGVDGPFAFGEWRYDGGIFFEKLTQIVDATGAGDCFNGTFLGFLLRGYPVQDAILRAHNAALSVIMQLGAITER